MPLESQVKVLNENVSRLIQEKQDLTELVTGLREQLNSMEDEKSKAMFDEKLSLDKMKFAFKEKEIMAQKVKNLEGLYKAEIGEVQHAEEVIQKYKQTQLQLEHSLNETKKAKREGAELRAIMQGLKDHIMEVERQRDHFESRLDVLTEELEKAKRYSETLETIGHTAGHNGFPGVGTVERIQLQEYPTSTPETHADARSIIESLERDKQALEEENRELSDRLNEMLDRVYDLQDRATRSSVGGFGSNPVSTESRPEDRLWKELEMILKHDWNVEFNSSRVTPPEIVECVRALSTIQHKPSSSLDGDGQVFDLKQRNNQLLRQLEQTAHELEVVRHQSRVDQEAQKASTPIQMVSSRAFDSNTSDFLQEIQSKV